MVTGSLTAGAAALAQAGARLRAGMAEAVRGEAATIGRAILLTRGLLPGPTTEDDRREHVAALGQQLAAEQSRTGRR